MPLDRRRPLPKRTRLKDFNYIGPYRYFLTISTCDRKPLFRLENSVFMVYRVACEQAEKARFSVLAFCFMPDHLHLLVEGVDEGSDLKSFISRFKQISGFRYKQTYGTKLWQASYYEHVLRSDESSNAVAEYILNNPVRKGLVANYNEYAYSGAFDVKQYQG